MNYTEFNKKVITETLTESDILMIEKDMEASEVLQYQNWTKENTKNSVLAWVLWLLLGGIGAHILYVGTEQPQAKGLLITTLILTGLGYFTVGISYIFLLIPWIWSAVLLNKWIRNANKEAKIKALTKYFATK